MNDDHLFFNETISLVYNVKKTFKIPVKQLNSGFSLDQNDGLSFTLAYLDKTYYNSIWKSTNPSIRKQKYLTTDFKTAITAIVEFLYKSKTEVNLHLLNLKEFSVEQDQINLKYDIRNMNTLHEILLYSPRVLDNFDKILFIFYQLLIFVRFLHTNNLNCGEIKLSDIYIDNNYWIRIKLPLESIINLYKVTEIESNENLQIISNKEEYTYEELDENYENDTTGLLCKYLIRDNLSDVYDSYRHLTFGELANITKSWCDKKISNFNYLLIINSIAGRKLSCPYNHPIFPWVSDFQSLNTNLRDLTMSKFRLNKGDPHLDLIYQASKNSATGPYHLTEFLSEITYFVYKSRITSKEILCKHVRRQWEPNEYPVSISRLYLWTPEECIPEFFCDTNIFKSMHDDLPDLKVPDWCNGSVEEFIRTHRLLLDSELVSKKLHHWIDLTFGYKLNGEAAVEAKNVCLPLIDNHQSMKPYGIVQLFSVPHPIKDSEKNFHSEKPPIIKNKYRTNKDMDDSSTKLKLSNVQDDLSKKKTTTKTENLIENQILLPDDYNPLASIEQIEMLLKFTNRAYNCMPDIENLTESNNNIKTFDELIIKDLKCLTCILTEILLFQKIKCLPQQNSFETRSAFLCKAIMKEPHIISGPFMPLILSVLKPFDELSLLENKPHFKKSTSSKSFSVAFFFDNILRNQSEFVNIDTLLNKNTSIVPFKPYFEQFYKFSETFSKLEYMIKNFNNLNQAMIQNQLINILTQTSTPNSFAVSSKNQINTQNSNDKSQNLDEQELGQIDECKTGLTSEINTKDLNDINNELNQSLKSDTINEEANKYEILQNHGVVKIESLYDQKFYLGLLHIPSLMFDMSDPKKNQLAQSICFASDSKFELMFPYLLNLFENPNTCVNSFLFLFNKLAKFMSHIELSKKFLPLIIQVLNVVDLNQNMGIDLERDDEKLRFCKLFEFSFINELRIIFGLQIFLTQICPFLIEAISGFKDFEFEVNNPNSKESLLKKNSNNLKSESLKLFDQNKQEFDDIGVNEQSKRKLSVKSDHGVFDMENLMPQNDLNAVYELDESNVDDNLTKDNSDLIFEASPTSPKNKSPSSISKLNSVKTSFMHTNLVENLSPNFSSAPTELVSRKETLSKTSNAAGCETTTIETERDNLSEISTAANKTNISTTAYNSFIRIIGSLGPVLTCKYCCNDLLKMVAICYMNSKCLSLIETKENPLNSIRPIEGDRFSFLILESLKSVATFYGEQVIVLQYLTHVSNMVAACVNRLTMRLEASLLAGIILVYYFMNYLEIKLLMDNLNYIINQILLPVINLYSNERIKFPNGYLIRQVLAFKVLDIILILSLRIGPEQTRIELEKVLKAYFDGFSQVRANIMNNSIFNTNLSSKPVKIDQSNFDEKSLSNKKLSLSRGASKARASIVEIEFRHHRNSSLSKDSTLLLNSNNNNNSAISDMSSSKETLDDVNSFEDFVKFSYDQNTNEIIGSSLKNTLKTSESNNVNTRLGAYRFRSQSYGLLSLSNEENEKLMNYGAQKHDFSKTSPNEKNRIENEDGVDQNDNEMSNTFTIELAHTAYLCISRMCSGVYMDSIMSNADLIHRMCLLDEQVIRKQNNLSKNTTNQMGKNQRKYESIASSISGININQSRINTTSNSIPNSSYGSSFSENVGIIGNQIQISGSSFDRNPTIESNSFVQENDLSLLTGGTKFLLKFSETELKNHKACIDTSRHLSDNWLAFWENAIRTKGTTFDFKHINLLTLSGHSSSVKCILPLDNESSIITGSKDKTVKLWSLKNHGNSNGNKKNVQTCQWTYTQHKKPVFSLVFIENLRVCASCDGSVHIWNPFVGRKLFQFENQIITCMSSLPSPSAAFVVATSENIVKIVDLRTKSFAYDLKTCHAPSGSIKSISTTDNLLLVGFSTGLMCLVDMRNGWIQESFKNLDNEILQLKFFTNDQFACTYNDGSLSISCIKEKVTLQNMIKVYNEPVPYLTIASDSQLITATSSNKIGIHSNIDKPSQVTNSIEKLKLENFKGVITSQAYLPLNRMLLVGADNGDIKLIC